MATQVLPFEDVKRFAARLGANINLVQGRSGALSIKHSGLMWVRAEMASLAIAEQSEIFIPLRIDKVLSGIAAGLDDPNEQATLEAELNQQTDKIVRPLPFAALDALIEDPLVSHVTPPDLLAITSEANAQETLSERLKGLRWAFASMASPGASLNHSVAKALGQKSGTIDILIISHWGAVVSGADPTTVSAHLSELTQRLVRPSRPVPEPVLYELKAMITNDQSWRLPVYKEIHALGCDTLSLEACMKGLLTLGQAMTLGLNLPVSKPGEPLWQTALRHEKEFHERPGYIIIPNVGVVVASELTPQTEALLSGFARMTLRLQTTTDLLTFTVDDIKPYLEWQKNRWLEESNSSEFSGVSTKV